MSKTNSVLQGDGVSPLPHYTVIIPAYNEASRIANAIRSAKNQQPKVEVIVADGGSADGTPAMAGAEGARVVHSKRGRGIQCNAGARLATAEILIFLHADTVLPENAFRLLHKYFANPDIRIATFRMQFDSAHWLLRIYAAFTRFDSLFTRFGDQCIVVRRSFFEEIGGFPDWPLFEDVHLLRGARRVTRIHSLPANVTTSARRFTKLGLFRCQLFNSWLLLQYLLGVPPERLAQKYQRYQSRRIRRARKTTPLRNEAMESLKI